MTCSLLVSMLTILLYRLLVHITQKYRYAFFLSVTYAFGTITFFYATRLYSHVFSTFFIFSAFVWLFMIRHKWIEGRRHLFGAGLCTGGAQCLKKRYVGQECYFLRGCHGQIHNPYPGQSRYYESTDRWQIDSIFSVEINYNKKYALTQ